MERKCSAAGCDRAHEAKGLCRRHYKQLPDRKLYARDYNKEYSAAYCRSMRGRATALKRAVKDSGLPSDITADDLEVILGRGRCVYCSGPLSPTGHGLDRKNANRGYTLDNVVPCCVTCNRIKNRYLSHEEMVAAMRAVLRVRRNSCGA